MSWWSWPSSTRSSYVHGPKTCCWSHTTTSMPSGTLWKTPQPPSIRLMKRTAKYRRYCNKTDSWRQLTCKCKTHWKLLTQHKPASPFPPTGVLIADRGGIPAPQTNAAHICSGHACPRESSVSSTRPSQRCEDISSFSRSSAYILSPRCRFSSKTKSRNPTAGLPYPRLARCLRELQSQGWLGGEVDAAAVFKSPRLQTHRHLQLLWCFALLWGSTTSCSSA